MRKAFVFTIIACLAVGLVLTGCGAPKEATSQDAIQTAKTMATVQEKTTYLVGQAKDFYASKEFQGAIDIAQYVLTYLDKDSSAAKSLLEKAKTDLAAQVKQAADSVKKSFGGFGK